ncbi:hypothetical protein BOTBODRAFT_62009 [Botryobasidium botryosum FD-172 SS1]|uniref:Major facilitator superfamily (MFS) profile domain-containing protein n=1 Tax=Botryobasidium botryosum (strain FD-172 SS1) TaxID=930990 RepID=A0A067NA05_BOTB1|nr:hypothetical protein BOTBODRAFT_62009 [Botryobasidium botryosum FD-172 SS1]
MRSPSVTRRGSGIFTDYDIEEEADWEHDDESDGRTPLDRTIDRIGMGYYQWSLLALCGFGWMADNMWLQAIAIVLPRVQDQYHVSDQRIGWLSASTFFGMMIGAVGWGTCSDLVGRVTAFKATLTLASLFGCLACISTSFTGLCTILFFLGTAVGGSMPTDGTLLLENVPRKKQYLLTALSVFFSLGAVLSAVVGMIIIPRYSCPENIQTSADAPPCDVDTQNKGWKYMFGVLTFITMLMFVARIFFFRIHESPRYLVHAGRSAEAVHALQNISKANGAPMKLSLKDVEDHQSSASSSSVNTPADEHERTLLGRTSPPAPPSPPKYLTPPDQADYHATGTSPEPPLANGAYSFHTATEEVADPFLSYAAPSDHDADEDEDEEEPKPRHPRLASSSSYLDYGKDDGILSKLPKWLARPLRGWTQRVGVLFTPTWRRTTVLVWAAWGLMSLGFTMFNVFLPKLLENRMRDAPGGAPGGDRWQVMLEVLLFTIGGTPGALLGAWMIETPLGRKKSLALSTALTGLLCLAFVYVSSPSRMVMMGIEVGISLASTTMWAVLYGMTPEIFTPEVRGTAGGSASAINRIGGMIAPLLGGSMMVIDKSLPVYISSVVLLFAACCVLALPHESAEEVVSAGQVEE